MNALYLYCSIISRKFMINCWINRFIALVLKVSMSFCNFYIQLLENEKY